jgi:hypothetical protein
LLHAVETANIREFIEDLPLKYNTQIRSVHPAPHSRQVKRLICCITNEYMRIQSRRDCILVAKKACSIGCATPRGRIERGDHSFSTNIRTLGVLYLDRINFVHICYLLHNQIIISLNLTAMVKDFVERGNLSPVEFRHTIYCLVHNRLKYKYT